MKAVMILRRQQVIGVLEKVQRRVHSSKMTRSDVVDWNSLGISVIGSQQYNYLFQGDDTDAAAAVITSKGISDTDDWETLVESTSRGTFQDETSVINA